jgi:hypothetical protein
MNTGHAKVLKLVFEYIFEILRLQTEIVQGLPAGGMIEESHQPVQIGTESGKLVITPCFAKGIGTVIAVQTGVFTP